MGALGLGRIEAEAASARRISGRLIAWLVFVGSLAIVNWAGRASGPPPKNAAYQWDVAVGSVVQFVFLLGIVALIARGEWGLLALRRPRSWSRAIGGVFLVLVLVSIVNLALDPILHPGREQGLTPSRWEPAHAAQFALFAFAVVVLAPITEELAFRGLGYGLLRPYGLVPSIVGSSFLWALAHGLVDALPVITLLGIGLAWVRHRQGSTIPGMFLHATFNALALSVALLA
jgi:membrane protease YdiL (CAAX protease family)